jgi:phosphoserine phosphatase RsbU/P
MDQHKLYRTIKLLGETKVRSDEQLLAHILENIIQIEEIPIRGGRIWKLEPSNGTYRMIRQVGEMDHIRKNFRIKIPDYPTFLQLPRKGTIVGVETNRYLKQKGIKLYAATGVGEKIRWKDHDLFPFVIAINGDYLRQELTFTLNIIGHAITSALQSRTIASKAKQLERDLDKARDIQKSILPAHELRFHNYDLYGISIPDRIVGGDFFDYLQASDDKDRLGVVVGDAASKGLSAAAQALYVSGALRMGIEYQTKFRMLVSRINLLINKTFSPEHFVSMVFVELNDSNSGLVQYLNAGHPVPVLVRAATGEVELLPATGQLVGPFPNERYRTEFTLMQKGDILVLYTDGITEATNETHTMYGQDQLVRKIVELRGKGPREMCQLLIEDVQLHNRLVEYSDDKTIVVIKRTR